VGLRARNRPSPRRGRRNPRCPGLRRPLRGLANGDSLTHGSPSIAVGFIPPPPAEAQNADALPVGDYTHPLGGSMAPSPGDCLGSAIVLDSLGLLGEESRARTTDDDEDDRRGTRVLPRLGAMLGDAEAPGPGTSGGWSFREVGYGHDSSQSGGPRVSLLCPSSFRPKSARGGRSGGISLSSAPREDAVRGFRAGQRDSSTAFRCAPLRSE